MSDVQTVHNRAVGMMDLAVAARKKGDIVDEHKFAKRAMRAELRAAAMAAERRTSIQTIAILARSANAIIDRIVTLQAMPAGAAPATTDRT